MSARLLEPRLQRAAERPLLIMQDDLGEADAARRFDGFFA